MRSVFAVLVVALTTGCGRRGGGEPLRMVARDRSVDAAIAGTEKQRFGVDVAAGEYVELLAEQRGVDVTIDVHGPRGKVVVAALDLAGGGAERERYGIVAVDAGRYVVEVSATYPAVARGGYQLAVRGPRPATEADRRRAAAFAAEDEMATQLGWKPSGDEGTTGAMREAALVRCEALRVEWGALADRRGEAEALELCATAARHLGRGEAAETLSDRAAEIYRALGMPAAEAHCLLERGSGRYIRGDVADARRSWSRALELAEQVGDPGTAAVAYSGLGVSSLSAENFRQARDELTQARDRAAAIGREDTAAVADDNLGRSYARLGQAELAVEHYTRALTVMDRLGMQREAGRTRHGLALVQRDLLDDPVAARAELDRALAQLRRVGNRDGESLVLIDLGLAHRIAGDLEQAAHRLDEAVAIARAIGSPQIVARARAAQGLVALDRGAIADALSAYDDARTGFARVGVPGAQALALVGHARAGIANGDLAGARVDLDAALALFEGVRARAPSPELRATYFASVRSAYDLDVDLHMALDRGRGGPDAVAAFEASERARSRTLLEVLQTGGGDPAATTPALRAALDASVSAVTKLEAAHAALLATTPPPAVAQVRASEQAIAAAVARQREALAALRLENPRAAGLIAPPAITLAAVQQLLGDDSVLLEYVVAEPRSYVFVVAAHRLTVRTLPGRGELEAAALALHTQLAARNTAPAGEAPEARTARIASADAAVPAAAARLAQLVLAPVAREIAGVPRILVAPDGALAYTPFTVLPAPARAEAAPVALIDDHDVVVLPSAAVLAALRTRSHHRAGPPRVAILADPVYSGGDPRIADTAVVRAGVPPLNQLPRLPFAADEAAAIAAHLPPERVRLATGVAARRELITGGALRDYDIVHIAAHGMLNARHPDLSGIALSMLDERGGETDGYLRLHELYQLELGAELVTLSGCETALGREIRGEGMIGLARGFLHAGARRVVASLWQVHDRATAELMRRFYEGILDRGLAPPAALRAAQRELRDQTPYAAPYFWAAFVLQGDDRP